MGHIEWIPIKDLPERLKDERRLLGWCPRTGPCIMTVRGITTETWGPSFKNPEPTHFAEINPPA